MQPIVVWFMGLSGSGKTTLSDALSEKITEKHPSTLIKKLDGDVLRNGLNNNLGFSLEDRKENLRRAAEVAKLFYESNFVVLASFITPTQEHQQMLKTIFNKEERGLFSIFVDTPLEVCQQRDVKGLYAKAERGEIKNFTGISSPFENPSKADLVLDTSKFSIKECVELIVKKLNSER